MRCLLPSLLLAALLAGPAAAQQVEAESFVLDNGMEFLLVPRYEEPNNIAAGWLAKVGSVNERPGITGISHFFEHMMFKGTTTIGTSDPQADRELMAQQQAVKTRLNELTWEDQYERWRRGEIDDPFDPANDTPEMKELRTQLNDLIAQHAEVIKSNEYDEIYARLGGSGINAFTSNDVTFFIATVPSNKFELWAWMESDRLNDSVFREFYAEREVVREERRLGIESRPMGLPQEQFEAMFWQSAPYSWPVLGWPSDLQSYTREQAEWYFDTYYRSNNLVGVVVGDFEPDEIKPIITEYFGRLKRGRQDPPPVVTLEMDQSAEKRMYAEGDFSPQTEVRYHTVPFNHADSFALQMMAEILNGRTGRLYKSLVEEKGIASQASAAAIQLGAPWKYAGSFSFNAQVKGEALPEELEAAWYEELERLQEESVPQRELQKVKNQVVADAYRRLERNFMLMIQLGYFEAMGRWEYINEAPGKLTAVNPEDIQRVAQKYFEPTNRAVAIYRREAGAEPVDPELAALPAEAQGMVKQMLTQMERLDLPQLEMALAQMQAQATQVPPEYKASFEYMVKKMKERVLALRAAEEK
ncbi:MAG: insulinase family protein [Phycisphaerales bacterium]|nr:MAG: insulinase family protein [Phycisphaerales bacterium]